MHYPFKKLAVLGHSTPIFNTPSPPTRHPNRRVQNISAVKESNITLCLDLRGAETCMSDTIHAAHHTERQVRVK